MPPIVALKVDVDTERGTRLGVPALGKLLGRQHLPACFFFTLGPDHTGRALRRIFKPGFFKKLRRIHAVSLYGWRTLLSGTLLPAQHIGARHAETMRTLREGGFEVGIHCYDHQRWQSSVRTMSVDEVRHEFGKARAEFVRIFGEEAKVAAAPGWQTCTAGRIVYDEADLLYSSDTRGTHPFRPVIEGRTFRTLEVPTTLPTMDELIGRPEFPEVDLPGHYASLLRTDRPNILNIQAELAGMGKYALFVRILEAMQAKGARFVRMDQIAKDYLATPSQLPSCEVVMTGIDGRAGLVATQGPQRV